MESGCNIICHQVNCQGVMGSGIAKQVREKYPNVYNSYKKACDKLGAYGVFGKIEGEEFDFEKFGVKITFQKGASVPCDRTGEYFWICIEGDFPYILDEERDLPITFSQKLQKSNIISKIKAIFKKK